MRWMFAAAAMAMLALPARAEDSPALADFMAFCAMRSPECIAIVARDLAAMKDTYCGPQPFDAMAGARRVYAVLKEQPPGTGTLHDAEVQATTQLWPCKKS